MLSNPHFATADSWKAARRMLSFEPLRPVRTAGLRLQALRVHVLDHKRRELAIGDRTLEAHYGGFVFTQAHKPGGEARRWALEQRYGPEPKPAEIGGHPARVYELGPEVPADDIDGRNPAVVVWHDGDLLCFIASDTMPTATLVGIANGLYCRTKRGPRARRKPA